MSPMSRMVMLGLVVMVIVFICSVDGVGKKGAKKGAKKGEKKGDQHKIDQPKKGRRTYQKQWNQTCKASKECDIYKKLDCHLRLPKPVCVCMFTIHEWRPTGCYDPQSEPDSPADEAGEEDPIDEVDEAEADELDEELPPPDDEEQPAERRKRRRLARVRRLLKGGKRKASVAPGKGKGGKKG